MPEGIFGVETSQLLIAVGGVAAGFLCLILVLWLIRGRGGPSPFLRGGKNRQPRLQVLDAAAVDTRRRLVLVRRDDVEHLIMIGGPTDVVIESSIVDGRSPPYHTMMKTVSEPERAAIAEDQQPRVSEHPARPVAASAPPARAMPLTEKVEEPAKTEEKDNFAWLGSEPVELTPAARPAEPARPATPPQPVARKPEPPKLQETAAAPAQTAPVSPAPAAPAPKAAEVAPPAETRAADPKPVVDFPVIEPRATSAAMASPAPVVPAFSASSAAVAVAPVIVAPIAVKAEPAPMVRIDDAPSATPPATLHDAPKDVARNIEPGFEIESPRVENDAPSLDNAVDLLDAVRDRVFQQPRAEAAAASATAPIVTPVQRPAPAVVQMTPVQQQPAPAKPLGSDFERILEEEMATNLAGGNAAPAIGPATSNASSNTAASQLPRRDPGMPRVTGATQEPALQNEIARIFGEMSVTKDDR
ncbi:hypothetical protein J2T09_004208 [Neorhizobium huautlense]|uniref:Flagellar biosynthesis protein FliO n=1 Tax=Neorhizobium huautlense TaxID=67774 RepID=A0ABT9PY86_9HYPH|nr:flagellar biosynthetic protein FliO [Neorhizobium huautlense]MDP9839432.1 hypothetical protein [Neorhizobium huautlense]